MPSVRGLCPQPPAFAATWLGRALAAQPVAPARTLQSPQGTSPRLLVKGFRGVYSARRFACACVTPRTLDKAAEDSKAKPTDQQSCSDMVARARWRTMQPTRSPYVKDEGERLLPPPTRTRQTQIFAHSRRHRANLFSLSSCKTEFDRLRTMGGRRRFPGGHSAEGNRFRRVTSARPVCGFKPVDAKRRGRDRTDAAIDTTSEIRHRRHP